MLVAQRARTQRAVKRLMIEAELQDRQMAAAEKQALLRQKIVTAAISHNLHAERVATRGRCRWQPARGADGRLTASAPT